MRIAILSSNFIRTPPEPSYVPKGYSGAPERIMGIVADALVNRCHDVTLFGSGDSKTSGHLVSVTEKSTSMDPSIKPEKCSDYEYMLIAECYRRANKGEFDIIHSIFDVQSAFFASFSHVPTIATLHSPLTGTRGEILKKMPDTQWYVSVSNAQRRLIPNLQYIETIYHGVDVDAFHEGKGDGGYLLVAGRMTEEKGAEAAIAAAKKTSLLLYLCGEPPDGDQYFQSHILPHIDNTHVFHYGFMEKDRLRGFYEKAKALLFPVQWEEPFGLVMIEAMASGTPVIAYNRGSVAEIVKDGVTGFIIDPDNEDRLKKGTWSIKKQGIDGLVEAIQKIGTIDRKACRAHVVRHFSVRSMIDMYENVYKKIINGKRFGQGKP